MTDFRKITSLDKAPDAVTLHLWRHDGQDYGECFGPLQLGTGIHSRISGSNFDQIEAEEAVRHAEIFANETRTYVAVFDPDAIWRSTWGELGSVVT